ncbi:hypothetical protein KCU93_g453, partial [Aureobasidium melanogenum]
MAYLLELLDGTLVDTTALVDQVTGGGRLTGVDVADNDDVNVGLFLTAGRDIPHVDGCKKRKREKEEQIQEIAKWSLLEEVKAYQIRLLDEPWYEDAIGLHVIICSMNCSPCFLLNLVVPI